MNPEQSSANEEEMMDPTPENLRRLCELYKNTCRLVTDTSLIATISLDLALWITNKINDRGAVYGAIGIGITTYLLRAKIFPLLARKYVQGGNIIPMVNTMIEQGMKQEVDAILSQSPEIVVALNQLTEA